jgi:hypothetical protein
MNGQLFIVTRLNAHVILNARDREHAKRHTMYWLGGNPDEYTVTPLTNPGDHIFIQFYEQGEGFPTRGR